ncbi:ABC transporter ATP-binding protein [Rathayibacter sp. Leaf248]|uniref:ABC transporter ATP-binding protein n=1 Tax=Rathayibacter sp. Leaf248 TaxID=2876555 RepID=UPI001E2E7024|nr:ABC transporter ATP-binding protein [Rathayibacter sp. Leaf248]
MVHSLIVEELDFRYRAEQPLIDRFSGTFDAGEFVAITGPSGRGKSTLLYMLGLMLRPDSGRLVIDGRNFSRVSDYEKSKFRAANFGFVFQDAALDATRTVLDNVLESALYRGESRSKMVPKAMQLMQNFEVAVRPNAKPGQVSGGQAQRIALCRALLGNPGLLLADEPTGNLDSITTTTVIDAMRRQSERGSIVIVVTHDGSVVAKCDREIRL